MKLAVFFPSSIWSSWGMSWGVGRTLRRMGHQITDCPFEAGAEKVSRSRYPKNLEEFDGLIVLGPEHIGKYLSALYPSWNALAVPRVSWFHEPLHRVEQVEKALSYAEVNFSASPKDTQCHYLPYAVDRDIFTNYERERDIEFAFIGLMYPKRKEFFEKLPEDIRKKIKIGNVVCHDLDGVNLEESAKLYAKTLNRIKTLVVLPSLSDVVVSKVAEGLACGCNVATLHEDMSESAINRELNAPRFTHGNEIWLETALETILSHMKVPVAA